MIEVLLSGFFFAMIYASIALGLSLIFGVMKILNIAQGEFYMLGGFVSLFLMVTFGLDFWLSLLATPIIVGLIAIIFERGLRRFYGEEPLYGLIMTLAYSLLLRDLAYSVSRMIEIGPVSVGAGFFAIDIPVTGAFSFLGATVSYYRIIASAIIIVFYLFLWYLIKRTKVGIIIRAAAQNSELLGCHGINVRTVYMSTFCLSAAMAGLAGVLMGPITSIYSDMGHDIILLAFTYVLIGGLGNIRGTILATIIFAQMFVILSQYLTPYWSQTILAVIALYVLFYTSRRRY
jgi:branched-chain amino acid transport system permease protein